jgi:hypothetical protein
MVNCLKKVLFLFLLIGELMAGDMVDVEKQVTTKDFDEIFNNEINQNITDVWYEGGISLTRVKKDGRDIQTIKIDMLKKSEKLILKREQDEIEVYKIVYDVSNKREHKLVLRGNDKNKVIQKLNLIKEKIEQELHDLERYQETKAKDRAILEALLVTTDSLKLKAIIHALMEDENPFEHFLVVDWRGYDEDIINDCEKILKTGSLKAEIVENNTGSEYDVYIYYRGEKRRVEYGKEIYRWTTINALNRVLKEEYQLRILTSSYDSDTSVLLPLSHKSWQELERLLGKELMAKYFEFNTEILF